jgi:hypothetical protein
MTPIENKYLKYARKISRLTRIRNHIKYEKKSSAKNVDLSGWGTKNKDSNSDIELFEN